jgi:hypothetical protein
LVRFDIKIKIKKIKENTIKKVEIPMEFRDEIYFFSNRDGIRDRKNS